MPPKKSNNDKRKEAVAAGRTKQKQIKAQASAGKSANVEEFRSSYDKSKKRPGSEITSSNKKIQRCYKFSKLDKEGTKLAEQKVLDEGCIPPATNVTLKYNLHLQSNGTKIGSLNIMKGYEDNLAKSSLFEMFLCKEGADEKEETGPGGHDRCSKDTTHVSNVSMLEEDLECSSSDENDDYDDDDSYSDTSSSDEEDEQENNDETEKDLEKNNNDDDPSITISSDSEDDETYKSKVAGTPKKEIVSSQCYKLFYENYEGTGNNRKVRCKLCPGSYILSFANFHRHIKYVHENHERQTCYICHKEYALSTFKAHIKTCQK